MMNDVLEPVFAERGFTFIQYHSGVATGRHRGQSQGYLPEFRHDSGALTRVIDQLAERGLLERVRRDKDRRKVEFELTDAGRK